MTKSVENNLRPKLRKSVKGIHSDFALETTQQTKLLNAIFRYIEICSDERSFDMDTIIWMNAELGLTERDNFVLGY